MKTIIISAPSQRLGAYLSFGLGAGVLGSQSAAGQIVYTPISPITVGAGDAIWFYPTTGAAGSGSGSSSPSPISGGLNFNGPHYIYTQGSNSQVAAASSDGGHIPTTLITLGAPIGSALVWHAVSWTYIDQPGWTTADSAWATGADGTTGYIGLRFDAANPGGTDYNYGWAEVTYNAAAQTLTLDGFAYDSTPGEAIAAGAEMSAVPEPVNTTLFFALGAAGLVALRRKRQARSATTV